MRDRVGVAPSELVQAVDPMRLAIVGTEEAKAVTKAWAIASELLNTGRGRTPVVPVRNYLCIKSEKAGYYWISNDGERVLYGLNIESSAIVSL